MGKYDLFFHFEEQEESFLRDFHGADHLHFFLALGLFFEEFALAGDIAAVTLGEDIFSERDDVFAGNNFTADGRLQGNFKVLARNQFAQFVNQTAGFGLGAFADGDERKGVDLIFFDQDIHFDEIAGFVAEKIVVHTGVAAADAFELVVITGDHFREREFIGQHGALFIRVFHGDEFGAFFIGQGHDGADEFGGHENPQGDNRFFDVVDAGGVREFGGIIDHLEGAVGHDDFINNGRHGGNQFLAVFAFQPFEGDFHVQHAHETETEFFIQPTTNITTNTTSNHLAYVIYTSGTTGNPKGVMIEHNGVINSSYAAIKHRIIDNYSKILQTTSYVFDSSVLEIYPTLFIGASLFIINKSFELYIVNDCCIKNKITNLSLTPKLAEEFLVLGSDKLCLKILVVGGEKLNVFQTTNFHVINEYGPTENTVCSTKFQVINFNYNTPIGTPICNVTVYVLNNNLLLLPINVIGELYIGGVGLARGYLNNPELTAEKFIANPFQTKEEFLLNQNTRLYKTGDLVRWLPDGNLEYIGRNDFQVKIRGYRIELGEIESALAGYNGIKQCVVIAKEHSNNIDINHKYLVGYYVAEESLDNNAIITYLQQKLPEYMVPAILVYLERLPLTTNGKLDRRALPEVEFTSRTNYVAPRNELEGQVCKIWAEVLGLPLDKIGIRDDFFRLGGNSILAIKLISYINKSFSNNINVSLVFKNFTIEKLICCIDLEKQIVIKKSQITNVQEQILSFAQERLWFIDKFESGTNAYNIPMIFELSREVRLDILKESLKSIVQRHEILRTLIKENFEGHSYQLVLESNSLKIKEIILNNGLEQLLNEECNHIYDLSNEIPIRICIYKKVGNNYLSIIVHHIAFDGWSSEIFLNELIEYYHYHLNQSKDTYAVLNLPQLNIQYKDFAMWQREYLTGSILNKQLNYWKNKLYAYENLNLFTDFIRPKNIDHKGNDVYFEVKQETSALLKELAKELKVSLYSILLSGYFLLLRTYSNQDDLVIGTPIANRHYAQVEHLIGFFVNTIVLRAKINIRIPIKTFIKNIWQDIIDSQHHQDLPFEKLVNELRTPKDTSRHPIFQIMFGMQSFNTSVKKGILQAYNQYDLYKIAKFDVSTFIDDSQPIIKGMFNYAANLYKETTINQFIETYLVILNQLAQLANNNPNARILDLCYLTQANYQQIISCNQTTNEYPQDKTIHELFEEQVARTPDGVAIIYEDLRLSYQELNIKANQLAHYMRDIYYITPDTLITLCLDHNEHMLIAILAVLKSGGAYVPIDISYPDERIKYILKDTNTKIIITNISYKARLEKIIRNELKAVTDIDIFKVVLIDSIEFQKQFSMQSTTNIITNTTSNHLAYVIYTSGTTGSPKGVLQPHNNVIRLFITTYEWFEFNVNDIWTLFHSYTFDFIIWEIYGALFYGGKLLIFSDEIKKDTLAFYDLCYKEQVTVLNQTPAVFYQFIDIANIRIQNKLINLRYVILGGERLNFTKLKLWFNIYNYKKIKLINMYGITEITVHATYQLIDKSYLDDRSYIGIMIPDLKAYVLDPTLNPRPIGSIGELYIGGTGLARGYLNNFEFTAERFIANPFQIKEELLLNRNSRLYKTGDLVRRLPDGNLEYIGRNDFQVKIRGYRIELGEIERVLASYNGVKQCVVIAKEHSNNIDINHNYLVGYYIAEELLDNNAIISYLQQKLPEYMVPAILIYLERLPLTINGKLDRRALPEVEFTSSTNYVGPRNELERQVCKIWAEVLGLPLDNIGIRDDFFNLGGDSIVSIQLASRLQQKLKLYINVKDIFNYRNIEQLYDAVLSKRLDDNIKVYLRTEQGTLNGELLLLPIQKWFFDNKFNKPNHWNQSFLLKTPKLELARLKISVEKLVKHHDNFRLKYKKNKDIADSNTYIQYYDSTAKTKELKILDINNIKLKYGTQEFEKQLQAILTEWQSSFNLEQGSLYSIGYIYGYPDDSARIYFALHHLIIDTVSWRILSEDLKDIYEGKHLGDKGSSYRQWAETVTKYQDNHTIDAVYWDNVLQDYDSKNSSLLKLIYSEDIYQYANLTLNQKQTKFLLQDSNKAYHTQINDLLLTALGYALVEITNNKVHHIILEGHGREEIDSSIDITRTVGWFTTMYPVRLEIKEKLGDSIKYIKEILRQIPNKGMGYELKQANQLPRVSFNYLGQFNKADKNEASSAWNITEESSGVSMDSTNKDYNIININGLVLYGKLQFSIKSRFDPYTTKKLAKNLKEKLEKIIVYCKNKDNIEYTMSDHKDFEPYVKLNETYKDIHKLFMFPPGGGGAESYLNNIVPKLKNKKLILFNNYFTYLLNKLGKDYINCITYEELANNYICYIKSVQSKGPYNLFGWSFGGVLAFEIARQLTNIGDVVENIVLIDSYFNYKNAVIETNTYLFEKSNINYKYSPSSVVNMRYVNIILFKALKTAENFMLENGEDLLEESQYKINKYYVEKTRANNLDHLFDGKIFNIIPLDCDHNSWTKDLNAIEKISKVCKTILE